MTFLFFVRTYWLQILVAAAFASLTVYAGAQKMAANDARADRDKVKAEFAEYKAAQAESAVLAAKAALMKTIADEKRKEAADAENETLKRDLADATRRLRDAANISGGSMPAAPAGSRCPDGQTCFDTAEYQRADGAFVGGARSLADEGTALNADLDTAKRWAVRNP